MTITEQTNPVENLSLVKTDKRLLIPYTRICNCPPNHMNCLTAKEWTKAQVALWEFYYEKRDIRDKDVHPAVFPIGLPKKCIELFTHKGELVLDPFVGSGTTLLAAQDVERNAVGFDLKEDYVKLSMSRLGQKKLDSRTEQIAVWDDAHNIPQYFKEETITLSVTSPPYSNMLNRPRKNKSMRGNLRQNKHYNKVQQYSTDPRDLGTMEGRKYAEVIGEIYQGILPLMKKKGHCVINVTDLWWENKRIPIHLYIIESMQKVGYELRNIIIWDRRNLVNGVGIFGFPNNYITFGTTFEYILDFWRPI
jgi:DNA modification methylase